MTRLSVNINKVATLRNARGEDIPNVVKFAIDCEKFGAQGITVHPRPDQRHITHQDVYDLAKVVTTEFNIEGYPSEDFMKMVCEVAPAQVTLVPDAPGQLTSDSGWDVLANSEFLSQVVQRLHNAGIRSSIFVGTDPAQIKEAARIGADRVELYTKPYADQYPENPEEAVAPFIAASRTALNCGIGLNAGHDLNLTNLEYFRRSLPLLDEVSIGPAIISDALYMGIEATIRAYRACLR